MSPETEPVDDLTQACARWGHAPNAWLDLSTGFAPWAYPVPGLPADAWHQLPGASAELLCAAQQYYGCQRLLPLPGSIAAIRALPRVVLRWKPKARVLVAPLSFGEHAAAWSRAGHSVRAVPWDQFDAAIDEADVAIVCLPNNPSGEEAEPAQLLTWCRRLAARGGWLVVDEAFRDTRPECSVMAAAGEPGLVVLRSLSPFFGLAGARVGFMAARAMLLDLVADELDPGALSGPAQWAATAALSDEAWQAVQRQQLQASAARLAALCQSLGLPVQQTDYFVWTADVRAQALHEALAARAIWTRRFEGAHGVSLRIGLPADETEWARLQDGLQAAL